MANNLKPPSKLQLIGNLSENWKKFKQNFENFMIASEFDDESDKRKIAILMNVIGEESVELNDTLTYARAGDEKKFDKVLEAFENYCNPRKNILHSRFLFYNRKQQDGESFDSFLTEIKTLIKDCEFQNSDELLRDKIVLYSSDQEIQDKMIKLGNIDLKGAIEQFRVAEITRKQMKTIHSKGEDSKYYIDVASASCSNPSPRKQQQFQKGSTAPQRNKFNSYNNQSFSFREKNQSTNVARDNHVQGKMLHRQNQGQNVNCKRCGYNHTFMEYCPAKGKQCSACGKYNHFNKVCLSKMNTVHVTNIQNSSQNNNYNEYDSDEYFCGSIETKVVNSLTWHESLKIENLEIKFKLDTGSDVNIISYEIFKIVKNSLNCLELQKCLINLEAYGGSKIKILGSVNLNIQLNGKFYNEQFIVTDSSSTAILGLKTCLKLGLISRNINSISNTKNETILKYHDVFEGIGSFPKEFSIKLQENAVASAKPPHRIPIAIRDKVKNELDKLCKNKIIRKAENVDGWINKLVIVEKPNGSLRLCLDPKDLNNSIKKEYFTIPTLTDLTYKLKNAKYFSVLDLKDGFWQIKLDKHSQNLCTFSTMFGTYSFNRLPFGLSISSEVFQKYNTEMFGDIDNVFIYIDDILIYGETIEEHDQALIKILNRARKNNIKFNKSKFQYKIEEIKYLGHIFKKGTIEPDNNRIQAIVDYDVPKNKKDLQRFLGLINYLRNFIPNLAELSEPLRNLLKKNVEFIWLENVHTKCVNMLKEQIINAPLLQNFDESKEITIQTDSSKFGMGCVLLQEHKPVCYASKSLTDTEINYGQIEKEFLAVLFACKKFHTYVYGRKCIIQTDHLPLVTLMKKDIQKIASVRLQRIRLKLSKYDIELKYIPGKQMFVADALSRACSKACKTNTDDCLNEVIHTINMSEAMKEEFKNKSKNDYVLNKLISNFKNGWPNHKSKVDNEVKFYYNFKNNIFVEDDLVFLENKIIVPIKLRPKIIQMLHESHFGINKTLSRAKSLYYWPNMQKDIVNEISKCRICEKFRRRNTKEPMKIQDIPELPFEKIACDILQYGNSNYLVLVDYYSKWIELTKINTKTAYEIINILKTIFSTHGIPKILVADNNPFNSIQFKQFSTSWNFQIITSSPYYPKSNGLAEKGVGICKNMLKKSEEGGIEIELMILEYRNTPVLGTKYSPSQLLLNRITKTKLPIHSNLLKPQIVKNFREILIEKGYKNKLYYDRNCKVRNYDFHKNQNVTYRDKNIWKPAKIISKHFTPRSFIIKDENNRLKRRNTIDLRKSFNAPKCINLDEDNNVNENEMRSTNSQFYVTRSGRISKPPEKFVFQ